MGAIACRCGVALRSTIRPSTSGSSVVSTGLSATSRSQADRSSSDSVGPAGLGYMATTPSEIVLRMKNASPIGMPNEAQRSSSRTRSGSHATRVPTGRYSSAPARMAMQASHAHSIRRSPRCSRWRWSSSIARPQMSQRSPSGAGAVVVAPGDLARRRSRATPLMRRARS